jgi:hypothetical protein
VEGQPQSPVVAKPALASGRGWVSAVDRAKEFAEARALDLTQGLALPATAAPTASQSARPPALWPWRTRPPSALVAAHWRRAWKRAREAAIGVSPQRQAAKARQRRRAAFEQPSVVEVRTASRGSLARVSRPLAVTSGGPAVAEAPTPVQRQKRPLESEWAKPPPSSPTPAETQRAAPKAPAGATVRVLTRSLRSPRQLVAGTR